MVETIISIENSNNEIQDFVFVENNSSVVIKCLCSSNTLVEIPPTVNNKPVSEIGHGCFFNHPEIKRVIFPNTIERIGEEAFALCCGLEELLLPDSITEIDVHAFRDCKGLKKVVMPKHLHVLRAGVFAFCYLQDDVVIELPNELEEIEAHAFYSGGSFKLVLPESVKRIGVGAFNWGPEVITSLPHDKGWYLDWPYGEEIKFADGQICKVTDYKYLIKQCMALEVTVNNQKHNLFYPCINERDYVFKNSESQKIMQDERKHVDDIEEIYQEWQNGLL